MEHLNEMTLEDMSLYQRFAQYFRKEYLSRVAITGVLIFIITLMIQGIIRFKGGRAFDGLITISIKSSIIENYLTIITPHLILIGIVLVAFRRIYKSPDFKNISPMIKVSLLVMILLIISLTYAFQFINTTQPTVSPFVVSQHEWRVENASAQKSIQLKNDTITVNPNDTIVFSVERSVFIVDSGKPVVSPYQGRENGTLRVNSKEFQVNDDELAEAFDLKVENVLLGFLLNPYEWSGISKTLRAVAPQIEINGSDIFPTVPRDDILGGNVTNVITFSYFNNASQRNITMSYDYRSGVLVHAIITDPHSIFEVVIVYSDDVTGFRPPTDTNTTTTTPTITNATSTTNDSIVPNPLITRLPISNQQISDTVFLMFLLTIPLIIISLAGFYYIRGKKGKMTTSPDEEDVEITLNNVDEIDRLPPKEQIIQRYRLATAMLEDMGAPKKESLTPSEFEHAIMTMFGNTIRDDFLILSNCFKLVKFEEERRLPPSRIQALARDSKTSFKRIKDAHDDWLQKIEELESREQEWEQ